MSRWREFAKTVKDQVGYYRALASDPRTPKISKWLIGIAIGYLLSPIDIIPDFIPVLGYLDDLIIVPGLIWVAILLIPDDVKLDAKTRVVSDDSGDERDDWR
jgi:uncharacterized membrane protein YkvA (DUF1232 family)